MDHKRLTNALKKAGATITSDGHRHSATKGDRMIRWFTQDGFRNGEFTSENPEAVCVVTPSPHTDSMTDCYCDRHHDTIKGAVASLEVVK